MSSVNLYLDTSPIVHRPNRWIVPFSKDEKSLIKIAYSYKAFFSYKAPLGFSVLSLKCTETMLFGCLTTVLFYIRKENRNLIWKCCCQHVFLNINWLAVSMNFFLWWHETSTTIIIISVLNYRNRYDDDILVDETTCIKPTDCLKFLGVPTDNHLSSTNHVDQVVSKCSSRIFLSQQLKTLGMNSDGLNAFYCSNIRSLLSYAAPKWFTLVVIQTLRNWKRYNVVPPVSSCLTVSMMSVLTCYAFRVRRNFYTNWARDI